MNTQPGKHFPSLTAPQRSYHLAHDRNGSLDLAPILYPDIQKAILHLCSSSFPLSLSSSSSLRPHHRPPTYPSSPPLPRRPPMTSSHPSKPLPTHRNSLPYTPTTPHPPTPLPPITLPQTPHLPPFHPRRVPSDSFSRLRPPPVASCHLPQRASPLRSGVLRVTIPWDEMRVRACYGRRVRRMRRRWQVGQSRASHAGPRCKRDGWGVESKMGEKKTWELERRLGKEGWRGVYNERGAGVVGRRV